ncbi:MAG TPA: cyanophycinase [Thermoanaerobaculia bacterium]|nr:cyanophycinase [Thermoanaerobaculia bacterium]
MTRALLVLSLLTRFFSGDPEDVKPRLRGPVLLLAGGGGDVTAGLQAAIDQIRNGGEIDVVVLRASGAEGYNPYFMEMQGVDSVLTMVITDRESAARPDVVQAVRDAELVYFAGGDQCNYIRWIKGTPVERAVKRVYRRGGAVGGTSAGLAIMGQYAYDACPNQSAKSAEVLADPFHADVSVSTRFFEWKALRGVVTDTHFQQRDRLGRTIVFMARSGARLGLGVSEGTIALVDRDGRGVVHGKGPVHIVVAEGKPEVMKPLTFRGLRIVRFEAGETFDLRSLPAGKPLEVIAGRLPENAY